MSVYANVEWGQLVLRGQPAPIRRARQMLTGCGYEVSRPHQRADGASVCRTIQNDLDIDDLLRAVSTMKKGRIPLVLAPGVEASSVRMGRPAAGALSRQRTLATMELDDSQDSRRDAEDYICAFGWSAASEAVAIKRSGGRVTYMFLVEFGDDSSGEWALFGHSSS